ncbi:MAG: DUF362 domain-containing protein [Desulfobacterales bacterium]
MKNYKENNPTVSNGLEKDFDMKRREFLVRSAKAVACSAAAGSLAYFFYDPDGPPALTKQENLVFLPDFSLSDKRPSMAIVRGTSDRKIALETAMKALGGIDAFIEKDDRVLLKVNAAFASPPSLSATTHPDLVSETIRLCYSAGAASVTVTDNPINDPATCFLLSGIEKAALSQGAKLVVPRENLFHDTTVKDAKLIRRWPLLYAPFKGITKLIGMAPVKDHHRSGASMTMKNWYGLLGGRRNIFHQDIHGIIEELAVMVSPTLVILDGIWTMMTNGPTGGSISDLKQTNTLVVSTDQVAADAFGATLLGKNPENLPHILKAQARGIGTADFNSINPVQIDAG